LEVSHRVSSIRALSRPRLSWQAPGKITGL
jgi:hypothetical protein